MKKTKILSIVFVAVLLMSICATAIYAHSYYHSFSMTHTYYEEYDENGRYVGSSGEGSSFASSITVGNVVVNGHGHKGTCYLTSVEHQPTYRVDYYSKGVFLGYDMVTKHIGYYSGTLSDN